MFLNYREEVQKVKIWMTNEEEKNNERENTVNALSADEDQPSPAAGSHNPPPADIHRDNANQSIAEVNVAPVVNVKKANKRCRLWI